MDIHFDIRGFLEIHVWICYGFSDQGGHVMGLAPLAWRQEGGTHEVGNATFQTYTDF